jgi:hypothetical protein
MRTPCVLYVLDVAALSSGKQFSSGSYWTQPPVMNSVEALFRKATALSHESQGADPATFDSPLNGHGGIRNSRGA